MTADTTDPARCTYDPACPVHPGDPSHGCASTPAELTVAYRNALAEAADHLTAIILRARATGGIPPTVISLPEAIAYLSDDLDTSAGPGPVGAFYTAQERLAAVFSGFPLTDDAGFDLLAAEVAARLAIRSAFTDREITALRARLDTPGTWHPTSADEAAAARFLELTAIIVAPH